MMIRTAVLLSLLALFSGCIWNRAKVNDANVVHRAATIVIGETHASELPQLMGTAPTSMIPLRDGRIVYVFAYGDAKTEGFTLVLFTMTKTNSVFSAIYVLTDANGIVQGIHRSPELEPEWETWPFGA